MSDQPPPGGITGILGQILKFIDAPWKAAVIVLLFIVGGVGWVSYQHHNEIVGGWLSPSSPALKVADVPEALNKLIEETDADLVQVWEVDLGSNRQRFIASRQRDKTQPEVQTPRRLPVITTSSDAKTLVALLAGNPVCYDITESETQPLARRFFVNGMKRACGIPIPPTSEALIGAIYLIWRERKEAYAEDIEVSAAREIARSLATH